MKGERNGDDAKIVDVDVPICCIQVFFGDLKR